MQKTWRAAPARRHRLRPLRLLRRAGRVARRPHRARWRRCTIRRSRHCP